MQNFFSLFALPSAFDLDLSDLEKCYFAAQRTSHPDRLVGKSPAERQQAIAHSMLINEAYETLKNPLSRARHLLLLNGITPDTKPSMKLLTEIMEKREALAEVQDARAAHAFATQNEEDIEDTLVSLATAFNSPDLSGAAELVMRLSYLVKLADEIRVRKKTVA